MAHFAELDPNNLVLRVIVVSNEDTSDINGVEDESIGVAFCKQLFGVNTRWKQTSYNRKFRKNYAGIGYTYQEDIDAFVPPRPYPSWTLNTETAQWVAPVPPPPQNEPPEPPIYYFWDEETISWQQKEIQIP